MFQQHSETHYQVLGVGGNVEVRASNEGDGWQIIVNGEVTNRIVPRAGLTPETLRAEAISTALHVAMQHYDRRYHKHERHDFATFAIGKLVEKQEGFDRMLLELHQQTSFNDRQLDKLRHAYGMMVKVLEDLDAATDD